MKSSYTEDVIIDSELEGNALEHHLKLGKEKECWIYEYNYRYSMASAIHMKARINPVKMTWRKRIMTWWITPP